MYSFDDGPEHYTRDFLAVLKKNNVVATFFVLGSTTVYKPEWASNLRAAYDAGHQIALHTYSHYSSTSLTDDQFVAEIIWNALAVKQVIGKVPRYFRPPCKSFKENIR